MKSPPAMGAPWPQPLWLGTFLVPMPMAPRCIPRLFIAQRLHPGLSHQEVPSLRACCTTARVQVFGEQGQNVPWDSRYRQGGVDGSTISCPRLFQASL